MEQIEQEIWMGRSFFYSGPASGSGTQLNTHNIHGRTNPHEKIIHWHVPFGINAPGFFILPDARTLPLGGPLYHFVVTADPGVPSVQWFNFTQTGVVTYIPPISVKWYLCKNETEGGLWAWKASGYAFVVTSDLADITNFGATLGGIEGAIDKYSVLADTWTDEADSGEDWSTCGVSWTGARSLIRKGNSVWSHTGGVTSFQSNGGFGNVDKCSFARMSGNVIGTRHYGFGNFDLGAHVSDYYEFGGNSFTIIPSNPHTGWNEGESAGVGGNQDVNNHHIIQILATVDLGAKLHPTFLFNVNGAQYFGIQPTGSQPHYARCPAVTLGAGTLGARVHLMGGAGSTTNSFEVNSRWHHTYLVDGLAGWLARPWIPVPLRGHGCQYLPNPGASRKCIFSMGKDHSFFPSDNVQGFRYDDASESFVAAGGNAWSSRQEQGTSWGHLD